jgi:SAM-dependent methyltransferase
MELDWRTLDELRTTYLDGSAGTADYWKNEALLAGYDATFARRIAWKWHWVLRELDRLQWTPPPGPVLDFGCGTGVAVREILAKYEGFTEVALHDRSARALTFAVEAVRREYPAVTVSPRLPESCGLMLVSHVLPELDDAGISSLIAQAERARAVIVVEPGTRDAGRKLSALRERLLGALRPVAPCVHSAACGMLAPENEQHWCHFFAQPPPEIFQDSGWARFSRELGIDLRSLPVSFLVMDRREPPPLPAGSVRMTGHQRLYKAHALLQGCDATGVAEKRLQKRTSPGFFKDIGKRRAPTLQKWTTEGTEITSIE